MTDDVSTTACPVARLDDLAPGSMLRVDPEGVPVCLVRLLNGDVHAISDLCSHEEVELSEGFLDGVKVECPEHGSRFDVRTGDFDGLPATEPIATYPVSIQDGEVIVEV